MNPLKSLGALAFAGTLAIAAAAPADAQAPFRVGSKNFTEQYVLGEIYAAALEASGIKVERKINLGGTLIAHKALTSNEVDMYPEYTGTALLAVLKAPVESDPRVVFDKVKAHYEKEFQVTWLNPSKINNGYAMLVRQETAQQYKLKTLTDLGRASKNLVLGAGPEFGDRADGLPGLKRVYGIEFKEFKQFAVFALKYDALANKQVDIINGFSTDWPIALNKYVALDDDKNLFPPYFLAPAARQEALKAHPKAAEALNRVSALLDNATMQQLNAEVESRKQEPKDVAKKFLMAKGVIK